MSNNKFEVLESKELENHIIEQITLDKSTGVNFLSLVKDIESKTYEVNVKVPINIIDDAAKKSASLLFIIFIPITAFIIIITIIFSRQFTNPIIEITKKTTKIIDLNFNDYIKVKSNDEIGQLANSVNALSDKIKSTLYELNLKNSKLYTMIEKERKEESLRREFISSISHELKSPIAVISGYAQMLHEGILSSKEEIDYYINVINDESERMNIIVSDLLDLYKLQSNTFKLTYKKFYIDNLINKIINKNSFQFDNLNINLSVNVNKACIVGDEVRIEQVIQNYLNNALSHVDYNRVIRICAKNINDTVRISVYNSGKNIKEKDLNRIWTGFVRIDKVRNYKEKRVGLGLAIVSQITSLHNGLCGISNRENGVEFWIKLDV